MDVIGIKVSKISQRNHQSGTSLYPDFQKALQAVPKWNVLYIRDKIKKYEDWIDGKDATIE